MYDLDELEQLMSEATPGPWSATLQQVGFGGLQSSVEAFDWIVARVFKRADAELIAKCVSALPDLIRELRAARERIGELTRQLDARRAALDEAMTIALEEYGSGGMLDRLRALRDRP